MGFAWHEFGFNVGMPHMAAGEKLSEVEFLKTLALYQWESIARLLGRQPRDIATDSGERLYGSVIDFQMSLGRHSPESLGEGADVFVRNRISVFANRFVEGLFGFDDAPIPDSDLAKIASLEDLRAQERPWAYMTNAFIARMGGNARLKIYVPSGMDALDGEPLASSPPGIEDQRVAQATGEMAEFDETPKRRIEPARNAGPIEYQILWESDVNGAGLVYFARYVAMANYVERMFLRDQLDVPLTSQLVMYLSCERRRVFYFANASPEETVDLQVRAELVEPGTFDDARGAKRHRTPLKLEFRVDLYRGSDKALMASTRVRKALNVPGDQKAVLMEAERFLRRVSRVQ